MIVSFISVLFFANGCAAIQTAKDVVRVNNEIQHKKGVIDGVKLMEEYNAIESNFKKAKKEVKIIKETVRETKNPIKIKKKLCKKKVFGGVVCQEVIE